MPKRTVTAGVTWLRSWKNIPDSETIALDAVGDSKGLEEDITVLAGLGYIVTIEWREPIYAVRCLPHRDSPYRVGQGVGLSYTGESLRGVLATASYEADLLAVAEDGAIVSDREAARWVAS